MTETNETIEPEVVKQPRAHPQVRKVCPFCGAEQLAQNLARHINSRHPDGFKYKVLGNDEVECPDCGHPFKTSYIDLHRKRVHSVKASKKGLVGRVTCTECGVDYARGYIGEHLRSAHNRFGGISGITRETKQNGGKELVPIITPSPTPEPLTFEMVPIVVLMDNKGGIWHAERVR